jgi:serine/threonine protein kinase/Tol biopolymer transport system component
MSTDPDATRPPLSADQWRRICAVLDRVMDAPVDAQASVLTDTCRTEGVSLDDVARFIVDEQGSSGFLTAIDPAVVSSALAPWTASAALAPGTRFGVYEVLEPLGAGGMGEVYLARDTRLNRDVALKVLPQRFIDNRDRLARFTREAQMLASVSHPNIAAIHGLEDIHGVQALVLELVAGSTLAERLSRGPLPLDEALPIAHQIAEALEAAHEHGIIHCDLKPGNIKLRPDGLVKVLDFGVATFFAAETSGTDAGMSSSDSANPPAHMGLIAGTAAYMSPEQARGTAVDRRTDIWAFGCVVFEMLTGRRPFVAESAPATVALILTEAPDWTLLSANTPAPIRRLLQRCLTRDRKRRLADAADARLELEEAQAPESPADGKRMAPSTPRAAWVVPSVVAAFLTAIALTSAWTWWRSSSAEPLTTIRFSLPRLTNRPSVPALSPDGSMLAFQVQGAGNPLPDRRIYLRAMDELEAEPVAGTDNAMDPAFSPDGRWLAFLTSSALTKSAQLGDVRQLMKIPVAGGAPQTLVAHVTPGSAQLSWGEDNRIYFTSVDGLLRIDADGGTPETLATVDPQNGEFAFRNPQLLPGGKAVIFTVLTDRDLTAGRIATFDLQTRQKKTLIEKASDAYFVRTGSGTGHGHLVYGHDEALHATAFNADRLETTGPPVQVVQGVRGIGRGNVSFGLSSSGTLAYIPAVATDVRLAWVDRTGATDVLNPPAAEYFDPKLSPDGGRAAVLRRRGPDGNDLDLWVYDLNRGTMTRLTFEGNNFGHVWSVDGRQLIYTSATSPESSSIVSIAADGGGSPTVLLTDSDRHLATSVSADGRTLILRRDTGSGPKTQSAYVMLPLTEAGAAAGKLQLFFESRFPMGNLTISPDGRWAAYESAESGREEIYIVPYPARGGKWQVSTDGGIQPRWSRNGRELFYRRRNSFVAVSVLTAPGVRISQPIALFEGSYRPAFDVAPDARRFLMLKAVDADPSTSTEFHVVVNWLDELRRRVLAR